MRKISLIIIVLLSLLSAPAAGQDETNAMICTSQATYWSGTLEDTNSIRSNPVPDSFRESLESGGCTRRQLVETSLLQWHRDFGTEATMKTAIEYMSGEVLNTLEKNVDSDALKAKLIAYGKIANYYYLGGESFNSLPLINKADEHLQKAKVLSDTVTPRNANELPIYLHEFGTDFHYYAWQYKSSLLELEYALSKLASEIYIRRAIITEKREHYEQAAKHLNAYEPDFVHETINFAERSLNSVCRTDDQALRERMEQACAQTFGLYEEFVRSHLTRKALLATVEDKLTGKEFPQKSHDAFSNSWRLLLREEQNSGIEPIDENYPYHAVYLKYFMALSDTYFHLGKTESDDQLIYDSLNQLVYAERYVPRHASPSQWRQLAEKYIEVSALLDNILDKDTELNFRRTKRYNQLAYFHEGLDALNKTQNTK